LVIVDQLVNRTIEEHGTEHARSASMSEQSEALKERTMLFAVKTLRLIDRFPRAVGAEVIARQLAKSATSVAANYRSACTARSRADFIAKLGIVVEEAEESVYWLDLVVRAHTVGGDDVPALRREATELRAVFAKSLGTARANRRTVPARASHQIVDNISKSQNDDQMTK
jgi:four helix bundle protein